MAFWPLLVALILLMIDAIIEVGILVSLVVYLNHDHGGVPFAIQAPDQTIQLDPKPLHLLLNQGHTSNGAAGTAFVLIGVGGLLVLLQQRHRERSNTQSRVSRIFLTWTVFTILSALLTMAALIFTFVVTHQTDHQTISLAIAAAHSGQSYPVDHWTPETWYKQVLTLPFADDSEKSDIRKHVHLMVGSRWNLIPLFVLGVTVCALAVWSVWRGRRDFRQANRESATFLRPKEGLSGVATDAEN